jgi:S1-C subfamily serine protease
LGVLVLGAGWWIGATAAGAADAIVSSAVDRAKQATVGVLDAPPDQSAGTFSARVAIRGTGVHIGDGYIVTARHVAERPDRGTLVLPKEIGIMTADLAELSAALVGDNAFLDLVVYRLPAEKRAVVPASAALRAAEPSAGEEVYTVGYPLGWGPAVTFGRVGNPSVYLPTAETRLIQADLSVCSGNSGGGLFTAGGELAGLMHAVIQMESRPGGQGPCSHLAFAIPGGLAKRIVEAIIKGEKPAFPKLGIQMTVVKEGDRWRVAADGVSGAALAGGVKKGDVLLAIDGTPIRDAAHLKNYLIENAKPGQRVVLRVRREQTELDLPIVLSAA